MEPDRRQNRALVHEVEKFAVGERDRLSSDAIEIRFRRSPDDWPKTSAHVTLERLPWATADLSVWDSGEADLGAAWGQRADAWDETMMERHELATVEAVRQMLDRLVWLVRMDRRPGPDSE